MKLLLSFLLLASGVCHSDDALPPTAIDFSKFTPSTLEAYFKGLISANAEAKAQVDSILKENTFLKQNYESAMVSNWKTAGSLVLAKQETAIIQSVVDKQNEKIVSLKKSLSDWQKVGKILLGTLSISVGVFVFLSLGRATALGLISKIPTIGGYTTVVRIALAVASAWATWYFVFRFLSRL